MRYLFLFKNNQSQTLFIKTSLISLVFLLFTACESATKIPPIESLDINKYSGVWYEIARYDHYFERGLDNVTATYTIESDGSVQVLNRGFKSGEEKTITGKAYRTGEGNSGILKVVFFIFGSEYRVIYIDKDYKYAVVTSSSPDYLWILARSPKISDDRLGELTKFITGNGFKSEKLIFVKHN